MNPSTITTSSSQVVDSRKVCLLEKPLPQEKLDQVIKQVANRAFITVELNGSALNDSQIAQLSDLCLRIKGVKIIDLEGKLLGGVHTNWSLYQAPQLVEELELRPSPKKAMELYKKQYGKPPAVAIDFGAGPGINIISMLLEGVEKVHAIDCDPDQKNDFFMNLGQRNLQDLKTKVIYLTTEFDQWETDVEADFLISNYTWPYRSPAKFDICWKKTLQVVRKGGYLCGEFFVPPEEKKPTFTYHTIEEVKTLVEKDCTLLWLEHVPQEKSGSSLDLQECSQDKQLPWKSLIRIVASKN